MGDVSQTLEVDDAGVSRRAGHDELGHDFLCLGLQLVVVNGMGVVLHAVGDEVVVQTREIDGRAVGEVAAVSQAHAHDGVTRLQKCHVNGGVGLRARVGLDVGVLGAEQLAGALNGDVLHHVHHVAAAVVALGGVALGVFIGQYRANGHHDGLGDHVLGGDQLQTVSLAGQLGINGGGNGGVKLGKVLIHFLDHGCFTILFL